LHTRRGTGSTGVRNLTWQDFHAWKDCTGRHPVPWEYDLLSRLDFEFFEVNAPKKEK
jgi:hypothetical protein